jgi:hypothetical protein
LNLSLFFLVVVTVVTVTLHISTLECALVDASSAIVYTLYLATMAALILARQLGCL